MAQNEEEIDNKTKNKNFKNEAEFKKHLNKREKKITSLTKLKLYLVAPKTRFKFGMLLLTLPYIFMLLFITTATLISLNSQNEISGSAFNSGLSYFSDLTQNLYIYSINILNFGFLDLLIGYSVEELFTFFSELLSVKGENVIFSIFKATIAISLIHSTITFLIVILINKFSIKAILKREKAKKLSKDIIETSNLLNNPSDIEEERLNNKKLNELKEKMLKTAKEAKLSEKPFLRRIASLVYKKSFKDKDAVFGNRLASVFVTEVTENIVKEATILRTAEEVKSIFFDKKLVGGKKNVELLKNLNLKFDLETFLSREKYSEADYEEWFKIMFLLSFLINTNYSKVFDYLETQGIVFNHKERDILKFARKIALSDINKKLSDDILSLPMHLMLPAMTEEDNLKKIANIYLDFTKRNMEATTALISKKPADGSENYENEKSEFVEEFKRYLSDYEKTIQDFCFVALKDSEFNELSKNFEENIKIAIQTKYRIIDYTDIDNLKAITADFATIRIDDFISLLNAMIKKEATSKEHYNKTFMPLYQQYYLLVIDNKEELEAIYTEDLK